MLNFITPSSPLTDPELSPYLDIIRGKYLEKNAQSLFDESQELCEEIHNICTAFLKTPKNKNTTLIKKMEGLCARAEMLIVVLTIYGQKGRALAADQYSHNISNLENTIHRSLLVFNKNLMKL